MADESGVTAAQEEQALHTQGQRDTSMVWETTQMRLALPAVWTMLAVSALGTLFGMWLGLPPELQTACAFALFGLSGMIVGFYFGRTNHTRVGGPGGDTAGTR